MMLVGVKDPWNSSWKYTVSNIDIKCIFSKHMTIIRFKKLRKLKICNILLPIIGYTKVTNCAKYIQDGGCKSTIYYSTMHKSL